MVNITKISRANTQLIVNQPFFATVAMAVDFVETKDPRYPTMATDGFRIIYNQEFVDKLSVDELAGVVAHEVMHIVFLHHLRRAHRHPTVWNIAADYAINSIILDAGLALPKDRLYDEKYANMSVEEIYLLLMKHQKKIKVKFDGDCEGDQQGDQQSAGSGEDGDGPKAPMWGGVMDARDQNGKPLSAAERSEAEGEVKQLLKRAHSAAKGIGKVPGGIEGLIKAVGKPKVNWQAYIQTWIKGRHPDDQTWVIPDRGHIARDRRIYMPSQKFTGAGFGVISMDVSGSVSDAELVANARETLGIIEMCKPDRLLIIQHDTEIKDAREMEYPFDFADIKVKGRGGTNIAPVFDYIKGLDEYPDWHLLCSDFWINDWPSSSPDWPILGMTTDKGDPPSWMPASDFIDISDPMKGV